MATVVYLNGEWVPKNEAKISIFDHGLLYGDGVFEGIRSYRGLVFKLTEHLKRLWESVRLVGRATIERTAVCFITGGAVLARTRLSDWRGHPVSPNDGHTGNER